MRTIILLIVFILVGVVIYLLQKFTGKKARLKKGESQGKVVDEILKAEEQERQKVTTEALVAEGECCGAHEVCEKTGKYNPDFKPDYYDDEELDAYKGVKPEEYTDEQIAEFEEILLTMKESDVAGWLSSLQLRGIELPYPVREKALMILG